MMAIHRDVRREHILFGDLGQCLLGHQFEREFHLVPLDRGIPIEEAAKMLHAVETETESPE